MRQADEKKLLQMAAFIKRYAHEHNGASPSLSVLVEELEISRASAYRYMLALDERGVIRYNGKGTMRMQKSENAYCGRSETCRVPIYGSVICGSAEEEEQHNEGYLAVPAEWVDGSCFFLRAKGDSMKNAGISRGDMVLVRQVNGSPKDYHGRIVVALTEDGNTLKRLFWEDGRPRLHPENEDYEDIYPQEMTVQGVALRVIKEIL